MDINRSQISYQGLNRHLSKQIFRPETAEKLSEIFPKSNEIVGNIPPQWVNNIPVEKRAEIIPQLLNSLGDFFSNKFSILPGKKLKSFLLTRIFRKYGVINKNSSVKITKVGSGVFSKGYKLSNSDGTTFFVKKFKNKPKDIDYLDTCIHGCVRESNIKTFLNSHLKTTSEKEHFPKFYYGDIKNGYYLEEYLSRRDSLDPKSLFNTKLVKSEIQETLKNHHLHHYDLHNKNVKFYFDKNDDIKAKCFDLGGVYTE